MMENRKDAEKMVEYEMSMSFETIDYYEVYECKVMV